VTFSEYSPNRKPPSLLLFLRHFSFFLLLPLYYLPRKVPSTLEISFLRVQRKIFLAPVSVPLTNFHSSFLNKRLNGPPALCVTKLSSFIARGEDLLSLIPGARDQPGSFRTRSPFFSLLCPPYPEFSDILLSRSRFSRHLILSPQEDETFFLTPIPPCTLV